MAIALHFEPFALEQDPQGAAVARLMYREVYGTPLDYAVQDEGAVQRFGNLTRYLEVSHFCLRTVAAERETGELLAVSGLKTHGSALNTAVLEQHLVMPRVRRRGYGRRMLHEVEVEAAARGYMGIQLSPNDRGLALYLSEGYQPAGPGRVAKRLPHRYS